MLPFNVASQQPLVSERFIAQRTLEWFFLGVTPQMYLGISQLLILTNYLNATYFLLHTFKLLLR